MASFLAEYGEDTDFNSLLESRAEPAPQETPPENPAPPGILKAKAKALPSAADLLRALKRQRYEREQRAEELAAEDQERQEEAEEEESAEYDPYVDVVKRERSRSRDSEQEAAPAAVQAAADQQQQRAAVQAVADRTQPLEAARAAVARAVQAAVQADRAAVQLLRLLLKPKTRGLCRILWLLLKTKVLLRTGQLRQPFGRRQGRHQMSTQLWLLTTWRRQRMLGISM